MNPSATGLALPLFPFRSAGPLLAVARIEVDADTRRSANCIAENSRQTLQPTLLCKSGEINARRRVPASRAVTGATLLGDLLVTVRDLQRCVLADVTQVKAGRCVDRRVAELGLSGFLACPVSFSGGARQYLPCLYRGCVSWRTECSRSPILVPGAPRWNRAPR